MKKLVLYGAFDRYNYGDNLMPILFRMFLEKYAPEVLNEFEIVYSSISSSDLTRYACEKTVPMRDVRSSLSNDSAVIVTGGEVLGSNNNGLFLHSQRHHLISKAYQILRKAFPSVYAKIVARNFSVGWDFPYMPGKDQFPSGVKIIYNTIGGRFSHLSVTDRKDIAGRLQSADFISVRDKRTQSEVSVALPNVSLAPDSAAMMSDLVDDDFLQARTRPEVSDLFKGSYIIFQAAPNKTQATQQQILVQLKKIYAATGKMIMLLPIGYATGHDDAILLRALHRSIPHNSIFMDRLNIWEIMNVIKHSDMYIGTSLHGAITAMSFAVPHFGVNPQVVKLDAFLRDWSIAPFNRCYTISELSTLPTLAEPTLSANLSEVAHHIVERVIENNLEIVACLQQQRHPLKRIMQGHLLSQEI